MKYLHSLLLIFLTSILVSSLAYGQKSFIESGTEIQIDFKNGNIYINGQIAQKTQYRTKDIVINIDTSVAVYAPMTQRKFMGVEVKSHEFGAEIISILPNSLAASSDLQVGDVIYSMNDNRIYSGETLLEFLTNANEDELVHIVYYRKAKPLQTDIVLTAINTFYTAPKMIIGKRDYTKEELEKNKYVNPLLEETTPLPLDSIWGLGLVQTDSGLVINSVVPNSWASKFGFLKGDQILNVYGIESPTIEDFRTNISKPIFTKFITIIRRNRIYKIDVSSYF